MAAGKDDSSATSFLNVDLDIYSRYDLHPLVNGFGRKIVALYVGRNGRRFSAHLELATRSKSADSKIKEFCVLVQGLPKQERDRWDAADVRDFSIGIRPGTHPSARDFAIETKTLQVVSELAARIVLTVYAFVETPIDASTQ